MRPVPAVADPASLSTHYPWPESGPWTRLAMLRTVDGAVAGADGRSRSVSSDGDRRVLAEIRRLADAVLTGAGTMRTEPYGPLTEPADAATRTERARLGLAPAPRLVVVSGSLRLPWDAPVFAASALPVLVVTGTPADTDAPERDVAAAPANVDVVRLPTAITAASVVAALRERGLNRLVCEGGPGLAAQFVREGVLDEVDLTLSPWLSGAAPVPGRDALAGAPSEQFALAHALVDDDGFVYLRHVRRGAPAAPSA